MLQRPSCSRRVLWGFEVFFFFVWVLGGFMFFLVTELRHGKGNEAS